jgi:hypothetical protein
MEIYLVILSVLGYYLIYKKHRRASYLVFIVQNLLALNMYKSPYMFFNILACIILITIITAKDNKYG